MKYSTSGGIKTENVKTLRGLISAHSIGREGPTPNARKPLAFSEIELASPQFLYALLPLTLGGEVEILGTHFVSFKGQLGYRL